MEEAEELCERVAIMDHGKILALDTPAALKRSVGADTIVTVKAGGDTEALAERLAAEIGEVTNTRSIDGGVELHVKEAQRLVPRSSTRPRPAASSSPTCRSQSRASRPSSSASPARSCATDGHRDCPAAPRLRPRARADPDRARALDDRRQPRRRCIALILRDLVVLRKNFAEFVIRTLVQPFLLVFVFLYVFPTIGQGVGGGGGKVAESAFATVLVPGVVGITIMFQGIQAVAMVMAQEFGYTREIEDRVQAPCPIWLVAIAKVLSGASAGADRRADRVPDRLRRARQRRGSPPVGQLA